MNEAVDIFDEISNPLDSVEDVLAGHDWSFSRVNPDELCVHVTGKGGTYRLTFLWEEEYSAMQFFCEFDLFIAKERRAMAERALAALNERLWLGHFDIPAHNGIPVFRHTALFRGCTQGSNADHIEDLVDIALAECERAHGVFDMVSGSLHLDDSALSLVLAEEAGQA